KSTTDKNFIAKANSKNPKETFTVFIQLPERGKVLSHPGNAANNPNGKANANENPNIPIKGPVLLPPMEASTSKVPIIGPVQLNVTKHNVNAIKKIPIKPPDLLDFASIALTNLEGNRISKAPKKEIAK